jgi:hypothetical protein
MRLSSFNVLLCVVAGMLWSSLEKKIICASMMDGWNFIFFTSTPKKTGLPPPIITLSWPTYSIYTTGTRNIILAQEISESYVNNPGIVFTFMRQR